MSEAAAAASAGEDALLTPEKLLLSGGIDDDEELGESNGGEGGAVEVFGDYELDDSDIEDILANEEEQPAPSAQAQQSDAGEGDASSSSSSSSADAAAVRSAMLREVLGFCSSEITAPSSSSPSASALTTDHDADESPSMPKHVRVLPLYAMMSPEEQSRIFAHTPDNTRVIIVATNVAETSITIPGIRYVVDCGKHKERVYDPVSGISKFEVRT